jgi:hypothetical protein
MQARGNAKERERERLLVHALDAYVTARFPGRRHYQPTLKDSSDLLEFISMIPSLPFHDRPHARHVSVSETNYPVYYEHRLAFQTC